MVELGAARYRILLEDTLSGRHQETALILLLICRLQGFLGYRTIISITELELRNARNRRLRSKAHLGLSRLLLAISGQSATSALNSIGFLRSELSIPYLLRNLLNLLNNFLMFEL